MIDKMQLALKIRNYTLAILNERNEEPQNIRVSDHDIDKIQTDVCEQNGFRVDLTCKNKLNMFVREHITSSILSEYGVKAFSVVPKHKEIDHQDNEKKILRKVKRILK